MIENGTGCSLTISIHYGTQGPRKYNKARKEVNEIIKTGKETKLPLLTEATLAYMENSKVSLDELLEIISKFISHSKYQVNIYNSTIFLYASSK